MRNLVAFGAMLVAAAAWADPGELSPAKAEGEALEVLTAAPPGRSCKAGAACFFPGQGTVAVEAQSAPVALAPGEKAPPAIATPRFARLGAAAEKSDAPWAIELLAQLKRPALAGNVLFLFFDLGDPESLPNREYTALYQAPVRAGKSVAARLRLTSEEGFRVGHSYRVRLVQLINGRELVLAESDVTLL